MDEDELEAELEDLQQEQLDEQMLKTGSVPVSDQIQRVPAVPAGDSKYRQQWTPSRAVWACVILMRLCSQGQDTRRSRGRGRRGRRIAQTAGRDGHVSPRRSDAEARGDLQRTKMIWSHAEGLGGRQMRELTRCAGAAGGGQFWSTSLHLDRVPVSVIWRWRTGAAFSFAKFKERRRALFTAASYAIQAPK